MDKKYTFIGALCIVAAIIIGFRTAHDQQLQEQYKAAHPVLAQSTATPTGSISGNITASAASGTAATPAGAAPSAGAPTAAAGTTVPTNLPINGVVTPIPDPATAPAAPPALVHLGNDVIDVTLTEDGGAIKTVTLKNFPLRIKGADPVMFNDGSPQPALALLVPRQVNPNDTGTYWSWTTSAAPAAGNPGVPPAPLLGHYTLDQTATSKTSVTFRGTTLDGLEITRTYSLSSGDEDPYVIHHTTTIANHGENAVSLTSVFVNAGMAPVPAPDASYMTKTTYLNFGYFDGQAENFVTAAEFMERPAAFLGLVAARPKQKDYVLALRPAADLHWVAVKDQFFATVLIPKGILGRGFYVQGVDVKVDDTIQTTISGDLEFNLGQLEKNAEKKLELTFYAGPKEYVRLDRLGDQADLNMQFGWFSYFSKILLLALIAIHKFIAPLSPAWAWGWTIIFFTIVIKGFTWPLTAIQVRSAKRMGQLSAPMKALKEKYKDNPQKYQTEMLELYKKYKINPAAGCLPLLITFPIFIAFNYVMRTASEMRFAGFLWIHDLSKPDTLTHLGGFALNLLPLLMTATMMLQMHLTPSPSADNTQKNIMKFMPLIFLAGFYTMPSGMILYWTCNNLFSIFQQYLTNRRKDDATATPAVLDRPAVKRR